MSLLSGIDPRGDTSTIEAAGRSIAERLLGLPTPRSLAELRLDTDDYAWLLEWASSASPGSVRRWLVDRTTQLSPALTRRDALGLLLFTVATEVARREAAEGQLWSSVSKRFGLAKQSLFVQGQPTYEHKAAFEAVAARYQLRNVFGIAGTQNWYVSTYLQFGFTCRGIEQLPMWLAGHPLTESIQDLLHDPSRRSEAFHKLFDDLRLYRRDNITIDALRRTISASPWVLSEWSDRLVEAARKQMHLGAGTGGVIDPEDALPFVGAPRLSWVPGQRPTMHLSLEHLAQILSDGTYYIGVARDRVGVLIADAISGVTGDTDIKVPMRSPAVTVTLRQKEDGAPVRSQEVTFWDTAEDVCAYDLDSGRQIDPWSDPLPRDRAFALILADDLELVPDVPSYGLGAGHRVHYVAAGWDSLVVRLEGAALWEPLSPGASRAPEPEWLRRIDVVTIPRDSEVSVGQDVRLQITNITGYLRFLRFGSTPINFTQDYTTGISDPIRVTPQHLGTPMMISIGIEHEGQQRVRRLLLTFDGSGALLLTDDGWAPMNEDCEQTVAAVESSRVKLIWRGEDRPGVANLGVMAGSTFIRRAWDGTSAIRGLPGFGAPLEIRRPYNPVDSKGITLTGSVTDPGVCAGLNLEVERVEVELRYPIEPDDEYQCVIIDTTGNVYLANWEADTDLRRWTASLCELAPMEVAAVAISYRERRIGAAFREGLDSLLLDAIHGDTDAERVAALSRWLRVPILGHQYRSKFERLTADISCEILGTWLTDHGLPEGLVHDMSEEWLSAVRAFYLHPQGEINHAAFDHLWKTLAHHDPRDHALTPLDSLDEVSPLYFLRGIQWALLNKLAPNRPSIAAFLWGSSETSVMTTSLEQAATVMQVDQNFLRTGVAKPICDLLFWPELSSLEHWQWQNLETCLSVPAFRRYLCARVLKDAP